MSFGDIRQHNAFNVTPCVIEAYICKIFCKGGFGVGGGSNVTNDLHK